MFEKKEAVELLLLKVYDIPEGEGGGSLRTPLDY
jgi:hypothetical protein